MAFDDGVKTVSGSVAHTDDAATKVPFVSVKCGIEPTLTGKSEVVCTQTEKNIYDKNAGVYDDTYFNQDGTTTHYADVAVSWIRVKPNTKYTFSLGATPSRSTFLRWINCDKDKNFISRPVATYGSQNFPYTVTTPNDCHWVQLAINEYPAAQVSSNDWIIQIEENSSATAYEAYNGTTYTVSLGRTIYGGQADIVKGECTKAITETKTFDGSSDENWQYSSSYGWFYIDNQFGDAYRNNAEDDFMACNLGTQTKYSSVTILPDMHFACTSGTNSRFAFKNSQYSTVEAFKEWLSNNNMVVRYTSATFTPFTFDPITPTPETVGKVNNVYCNTGDTELTYYDNAHGFAEVTVNRTWKNLFDKNAVTNNTWIVVDGTATESATGYRTSSYIPVKANTRYYVSTKSSNRSAYYDKNGNGIAYFAFSGGTSFNSLYDGYIRITIKNDIDLDTFVVNEGSEAIPYEPFGIGKTAYLHKVIYGGKADVIKGTCEPKNLTQYTTAFISTANVNVQQLIFSIDLTGGQAYTISCKQSESVSTSDRNTIGIRPRGGSITWENTTANFNPTNLRHVLTYTPPTSGTYEVIFWANKPTTIATYNEWQVEKSNSASDYAPGFTPFTFTPISIGTDEGENTLFANEGDSAITYRKEI